MSEILNIADKVQFSEQGFLVRNKVLPEEMVQSLIDAVAVLDTSRAHFKGRQLYAVRDLLHAVPAVRDLAGSAPIRELVAHFLQPDANVVRGIFFDKPEAANWKVAWHQDVTIALKERRDTPGFSAWSVKAGIPHAQPPDEILESILTMRIHLDDAGAENGALKVVPGSHRHGKLVDAGLSFDKHSAVTCSVKRGGVVLMRPLLLHSSSPASEPRHRRVIHLEFSAAKLPNGLEWYGS